MPSVGMRRTTRVFGVVKGTETARVLRSGKRLWPDSGEGKIKRGNEGDDWFKPFKNTEKVDDWPRLVVKTKQEMALLHTDKDFATGKVKRVERNQSLNEDNEPDKMFGIFYSRKRKRTGTESSELSANIVASRASEDKMFGLQYSRRQRRKRDSSEGAKSSRSVLAVVVKPSCVQSYLFSCFLFLVLRYIRRFRLTLNELSAFVLSDPIWGAYASGGIQFLQGPPTANVGICQFLGTSRSMPLFCVDFSAIPRCFKYLHYEMLLRSMLTSFFIVNNLLNVHSNVEVEIDFPEFQSEWISCHSFDSHHSESVPFMSDIIEINESIKCSSLSVRNGQNRKTNPKRVKRRRSSLRKRKARNPSQVGLCRSNGALSSDLMNGRKSSVPSVASNKKLRCLASSCTTVNFREAISAMASTEELYLSHCAANILITESDKCYRVEGAIVSLEMSASKEWHLTVKKDGLMRCTLKAEEVMRPCSSNRHTHVIMFPLENGWKLEFANRQDWIVFKDLYKECSDRNVSDSVSKFIPIPGVCEVADYADSIDVPFHRPATYISANGDELSRAMKRRTANYDMDSEDEEWLRKFNNETEEHVSEDNFELMIDALEKAYYCNPDDCYDEKSAANHCQGLGSKEVIEAVCSYWSRKRKQKRSSLLRIFQGIQSKRAPLIPKPALRKRRSFKRQPSRLVRGNQPSVLRAIAAERDALEENNAKIRIEAARASANESRELAIQKRKRAQILMENADLATYKATMLIRIAEAAQAAESVDSSAGYFLD